jgi:murein DD-endopeptidase MepM/ murein hydrolase activator NlpD
VIACYEFSNYGNTVDILHSDGSRTRYAHQPYGGLTVNCGDWVSQGQRIGSVGSTGWSTGPHLHFETWPTLGYRVNPRYFMADRGVWF